MTKRQVHIEALYVSATLVRKSIDQEGLQCEYPEEDQEHMTKAIKEIADSLFERAYKLENKEHQ